ncbi:DNA adenine methylase [Phyllobacterium phragmitis]|uniref:site-specific DNA-methyltransferase (adenine-specific) n=1 Tax=Phyllobacterium phragmitis TaxID=2670329 RepID=A0ABQ0GXN8_9HYPH
MLTSPLRYPGGKAKLFEYLVAVIRENSLYGSTYCEPYAGGAGLALKLLTAGFVRQIALNDIDPSIFAFWRSVLFATDELCSLIETTPITIEEWHHQKSIWRDQDTSDLLKLGFATFFLNRANRSGIIDGAGPIGGYGQMVFGGWMHALISCN